MKINRELLKNGSVARVTWFFVIGLILLLFPGLSWDIVCMVLGGLLLVLGVVRILAYRRRDAAANDHTFAIGLILTAAGLIIALMPKVLGGVLHVLIGFVLIAAACVQLETVSRLKRMGGRWTLSLIGMILTGVMGVVILMNPFSEPRLLMRFIGIAMIVEALSDGGDAMLLGHVRKLMGEK